MLSRSAINFLSGSVLGTALVAASASAQSIQYTAPAAAPAPVPGLSAPAASVEAQPGYGYQPAAPFSAPSAPPPMNAPMAAPAPMAPPPAPMAAAPMAPQPAPVPMQVPQTLDQQAQQLPPGYVPSVPAGGAENAASSSQTYQMQGADQAYNPTLYPAPMPAPQALNQTAPSASNDTFFISGGVGKAERDRLEAMSRDYNFKMQMATSGGAFVSDVNVKIKDAKGNVVLETVTDGPLLMAKLPTGKYTVTASKFGETKTQTVQVGAKSSKPVNIFWNREAA
jgi:hypothetical protein